MNSARGYPQELPLAGGLPHSEIPGSTIARISPGLFAACRVLHRLSVPRHPPDALLSRSITRDARPADDPRITRTASRPPENRRAQGQAPPSLDRGATPPAAARMKTLLRTAPRTGSHPTGQQPHRTASQCRGPSASVTFTNPLHPSINTSPGTPAAGAGHARPAAPEPEPNLVFSEHLVIGAIRSLASARVEVNGIEPMTSCLQSRRSPN